MKFPEIAANAVAGLFFQVIQLGMFSPFIFCYILLKIKYHFFIEITKKKFFF